MKYFAITKKMMLYAFFATLLILPFVSAGGTEHWSVGNIIIDDPTIGFRLDIYSPVTPASYPVLIFLPGLAGVIPATFYTNMSTTIAEQNVILIAISKIENIKPEKVAIHVANFLEWVMKPDDGAARLFAEHKAVQGVTPNMTNLGFLTHSSAAHPLGQYLNETCGPVKLIIMMNPVDGIDPWGEIKDFITRKNNVLVDCIIFYSLQILLFHFHFEHRHSSSVLAMVKFNHLFTGDFINLIYP